MPRTAVGNRHVIRDFGTCLNFNGSSGDVLFVDSPSLDMSTALTITAWINPKSAGEGNFGRIVDKDSTAQYAFIIDDTGTGKCISANLASSTITGTANTITLNEWQHVAMTWDNSLASGQVKLYVNASGAGTGTFTSTLSPNISNLRIGNRAAGDRTFNGLIDEVKIWNRGLSASEVEADCFGRNVSTSGLVLHAKLDEGSGTAAIDSTGTQANGTVTTATYSSDVFMKPRTVAGTRTVV